MSRSLAGVDAGSEAEQRGLRRSSLVRVGLALSGIVFGIVVGSRIILFDGAYAMLALGMSWAALHVSKMAVAAPSSSDGSSAHEKLTALLVVFESVAVLALCVYASFDATLAIVAGDGVRPEGGFLVYSLLVLLIPLAMWSSLRRAARTSGLLASDATQWLAATLLGAAMVLAFVGMLIVEDTAWQDVAPYLDPVLVILVCVVLLPTPIRMIRRTFLAALDQASDTTSGLEPTSEVSP